jgi:CRP-like cAMP-binding protein
VTADEPRTFVLREFDLFQDLDDDEVGSIGAAAPMRELPVRQVLFSPTTPTEVLFILKEGRVRLFTVGADGRTLTTAIVEAGQVFGEMASMGQSMTDTWAETLEPCTVCLMSREDVQRLLMSDPRIAARIAEYLGQRVAELESRLADTVLKSAADRVVGSLLRMAQHDGETIRLTHEQLADLVGTTRETVTKVLGELAERRLVQLKRGRIVVIDRRGLAGIAEGGSLDAVTGGYRR